MEAEPTKDETGIKICGPPLDGEAFWLLCFTDVGQINGLMYSKNGEITTFLYKTLFFWSKTIQNSIFLASKEI